MKRPDIGVEFGSSPRVRGTLRAARSAGASPRFIPACAGNAAQQCSRDFRHAVHPRVCGERPGRHRQVRTHSGSSPRVRGTLPQTVQNYLSHRFIPACAGNAHRLIAIYDKDAVHPRVCGERAFRKLLDSSPDGSSPRVRGTRASARKYRVISRFIPACAGNAPSRCRCRCGSQVHPRVCGERPAPYAIRKFMVGSSPRVRGTPDRHIVNGPQLRFIPACAGNAFSSWLIRKSLAVHPRVCGERGFAGHDFPSVAGSSPRVRGTLAHPLAVGSVLRFIPACAGNALATSSAGADAAVHPRVCGERGTLPAFAATPTGSSPRVRGTRRGDRRPRRQNRFIPACAGNAPC